jgi:leader peptidase (prepilin peptidase)/N-methyltransferase
MEWWFYMPIVMWSGFALVLGLIVGSFLNVLVARLPHEKSIVWPSSRCFSCFQKIRLFDNLPILGYLRLRGKCRHCGVPYSARYLWVEIGTGVAFLAIFLLDIVVNPPRMPGVQMTVVGASALPSGAAFGLFFYHAFLVACLIAAAAIDAEHRIIPPIIPYTGVFVGIVGGALMPWPWPAAWPVAQGAANFIPPGEPWTLPEHWGKIPSGVQPWPFWGPTFAFAPPGSFQMGLLNGVLGALAGSFVVRVVKWLFEVGFGKEALGLGDADLLMMAGAFLGWQIAVLSLFVGAFTALALKIPELLAGLLGRSTVERELPFGPGLALGVVVTWLAWPWLGARVQVVFFDATMFGMVGGIMVVGMLSAGLLLRRKEDEPAPPAAAP